MESLMHRFLPAPLSVYAALIAASPFSVQNALAGQAPVSVALQRDFEVTARYLHIPIKNGAPKRLVTTRVDGRVMVKNTIELTSPNLRAWTTASVVEGVPGTKFLYECPEFFELAVDGDPAHKKWVLFGADSDYATGTFDGTRFTAEQTRLTGHRGPRQPPALYAAQTFNDIPANDGRRILMGWFRTFTNGMPFNQSMSLPVELKLVSTPEGPRLSFTPIRELQSLRAKTHDFGTQRLEPGGPNPLAGVQSELVELRAEFEPGETGRVVFTVRGATIAYDAAKQELAVNGHPAPAPLRGGRQRLIIFCDRTGLEVHAADCLTYIPMPFQPQPANLSLTVETKGIGAKFQSLQVHELRSAWDAD
jgi:sucrose-6-phosphate hydrolase SacC (GH32 family)